MVDSTLFGPQEALPLNMYNFVSPLSGYQPGPPQQTTAKVMRSHTQDIFKVNATFIYSLSCFSHFILFQSLVLFLILSLPVSFSFFISISEAVGLEGLWER